MKENTLDVLIYLFEHCLDEDRHVQQDEPALKEALHSAGFARTEINKALLWLENLAQQHIDSGANEITASGSMRFFSAQELAKLDQHCRGLLLALEQHKILDADTREIIIERVMALEMDELSLERFKWIVMMVLANQPNRNLAHTWLETILFDRASEFIH